MSAAFSRSARTFSPGRRFDIVSHVGTGAMGLVYEAIDRERGARVALKALRTPDAEAIVRLKSEFRAVEGLRHANLVTPSELFEHEGQWFFTMAFVRGVDFLSYVRPEFPSGMRVHGASGGGRDVPAGFDEIRLRLALPQLVAGLCALHADHKVHRDVKPSNILVTDEGRVQILDFGIVRDLTEDPDPEMEAEGFVGSVSHMAPEQALGDRITPAADWYAVGVLLYQALVGRLPFQGTAEEMLAGKLTATPVPPAARVADVPADLSALAVRLLAQAPEDRPEGEELGRLLGVTGATETRTATQSLVFIGRQRELGVIDAAYARAKAGQPATLLVSGESGVGKSWLVREFAERASKTEGALVVRGRCYERESLPYKAVDSVVDGIARYLLRQSEQVLDKLLPPGIEVLRQVFPVLATVPRLVSTPLGEAEPPDPHSARERVFSLCRSLLTNVAKRSPLIIVIDDLQWADADSLALLSHVLRPPDAPPFLLLATLRNTTTKPTDMSVHARLENLPGGVEWLTLDPLPTADAKALIRSLLAGSLFENDPSPVDWIELEARGHPLFIHELVRHRRTRESEPPARLDEALWGRVLALPEEARVLLEAVAVAGIPISQKVIAKTSALDGGRAFDAIALLRSANLVRTSGVGRNDTVEPYHDRVRESVLANLEPEAKREWHGRLALSMEQQGENDPEKLIPHWVGAGEGGRAAVYAVRAAETATAGFAFDHAASLYDTALLLGDFDDVARAKLKVRLAEALTNAGHGGAAAAVFLEAAGAETNDAAIDLKRRAAEELVCSGQLDEGIRVIEEVLRTVDIPLPKSPAALIVAILLHRLWFKIRGFGFRRRAEKDVSPRDLLRVDCLMSAGNGMGMQDIFRATYLQARTLAVALRVGETARVARALGCYAATVGAVGSTAFLAAMRMQKLVEALAREADTPFLRAAGSLVSGFAHHCSMQYARGREYFERAERIMSSECVGVTFELTSIRTLVCRELVLIGDFAALERRATAAVSDAVTRGDHYTLVNFRTNATPFLALVHDDAPLAQRELDLAELDLAKPHLAKSASPMQSIYFMVAQAHVWLYTGQADRVVPMLDARLPSARRSLSLRLQILRIMVFDVRARACVIMAAAEGPGGPHRKEALRLATALSEEGVDHAKALAGFIRASLASLDGLTPVAIQELEKASELLRGLRLGLLLAVSERRRGLLLGGEAGALLVREQEAWMEQQGVNSPAKFAELYLPAPLAKASMKQT